MTVLDPDAAWNAALLQAVQDGVATIERDDRGNPTGIRIPDDDGTKLREYIDRAQQAWQCDLAGYITLHSRTTPPDQILDPFIGSGTAAAVAQKLDRRFIGIDANQTAVDVSAQRLADSQTNLGEPAAPDVSVEHASPASVFFPPDECPLCRAPTEIGDVVPRHDVSAGDGVAGECVAGEKPREWVVGQIVQGPRRSC